MASSQHGDDVRSSTKKAHSTAQQAGDTRSNVARTSRAHLACTMHEENRGGYVVTFLHCHVADGVLTAVPVDPTHAKKKSCTKDKRDFILRAIAYKIREPDSRTPINIKPKTLTRQPCYYRPAPSIRSVHAKHQHPTQPIAPSTKQRDTSTTSNFRHAFIRLSSVCVRHTM